jgi:aspartyl/asparaginyl beta-hydroxylase (cupin superfamily)
MDSHIEPKFWEEFIRDVPCVDAVIKNWEKILKELEEQIEKTNSMWLWSVPRVTVTQEEFKSPTNKNDLKLYEGKSWKMMGTGVKTDSADFTGLGEEVGKRVVKIKTKMPYEEALRKLQSTLPNTVSILSEYSDRGEMCNTALSVVSPGTKINPHRGDPSHMRVHVGLKCDPNCKIFVGNDDVGYESRTWSPGGMVAFKDGGKFCHSVTHNGSIDRWILIFDIPLDYLRTLIDSEYL